MHLSLYAVVVDLAKAVAQFQVWASSSSHRRGSRDTANRMQSLLMSYDSEEPHKTSTEARTA